MDNCTWSLQVDETFKNKETDKAPVVGLRDSDYGRGWIPYHVNHITYQRVWQGVCLI